MATTARTGPGRSQEPGTLNLVSHVGARDQVLKPLLTAPVPRLNSDEKALFCGSRVRLLGLAECPPPTGCFQNHLWGQPPCPIVRPSFLVGGFCSSHLSFEKPGVWGGLAPEGGFSPASPGWMLSLSLEVVVDMGHVLSEVAHPCRQGSRSVVGM